MRLLFSWTNDAFPSVGFVKAYFNYNKKDEKEVLAQGNKVYGERKSYFLDKNGVENPLNPPAWYSDKNGVRNVLKYLFCGGQIGLIYRRISSIPRQSDHRCRRSVYPRHCELLYCLTPKAKTLHFHFRQPTFIGLPFALPY